MSGKGSKQRPAQISKEELDKRWEAIFGKKKAKPEKERSVRNKA